jgi:vancomycin resistance protein YoaR
VSGIYKVRAKEIIDKELGRKILDDILILRCGEREWKFNLNDIAYSFLTDETIEKAYKIGREGNFIRRLRTIYAIRRNPVNLVVTPQFDRVRLKSILEGIKSEIDQKGIDASANYRNGTVTFNREVIGKNIEIDKNLDLLENILLERNFSPIELKVDDIVPRVKYDEISVIEKVISTFSTSFNQQKADRTFNIRLACERINNTILLPGEVFSMDKALGPRSIDNGYKNAPVIIKGKLIEGVGGGVCQVTTTLYVAVLKTKLEVQERRPHSMPLSYVEPGQDATISEGYIDFKFRNNKDYPVLISAQVSGNSIIIRIIGKKDESLGSVKLKSVIIKEIPPEKELVVVDETIPDGERIVEKSAVTGQRVAVYRETYDKNNKLIEREKISEDLYQPVRGIIRVSPNYVSSEQGEAGNSDGLNALQ